jgi:ubiquinone/menaquinone biosynthesis C-methylase UbiE
MLPQSTRVSLGRILQKTLVPAIDFKVRLMNWDFRTEHELFVALVGNEYGPRPELKQDEIRKDKAEEARGIAELLGLGPEDTVLDLGSGTGYLAREIAERVSEVHCADISSTFLRLCRKETRHLGNVRHHLVRSGSLSGIEDKSITKGFAASVFIHLNLYDIALYLRELDRVLDQDGRFLFSLYDSERLDVREDRSFGRMLEIYKHERATLFNLPSWNPSSVVLKIAAQTGFPRARVLEHRENDCLLMLER